MSSLSPAAGASRPSPLQLGTSRRGSAALAAPSPFDGSARATPRSAGANDMDERALDEIRRYESFSTVDWIADSTRERARVARQHASPGPGASPLDTGWGGRGGERPPRWWPSSGPWGRIVWAVWLLVRKAAKGVEESAVVIGVGALIGLNMAVISIATEWASDLKTGYCTAGWWLNRKFCCWEFMEGGGPGGTSPIPSSLKPSGGAGNATMLARAGEALEWGMALVQRAEVQPGSSSEACSDWQPWSSWTVVSWVIYVVFAAIFAALCSHLVRSFAPYAAGSGISEIKCILAGFIINGFLGTWTFAVKSLTLPLAIASGLSVGKEGPAVHVACCIGNVVASFVKSFDRSQARMRELLTAASAAGVAVAFGSPIGGVLFSLEEMAYNFPASTMWRSFLCALASTVTLSFMNPFRTGKLVLFQVSYDRDWHYFEMFFYSIIGVFGGLYGAFIIKYNLQVQRFRRDNLAAHGVAEAIVLATLTAFVGYWNKFLRIDMSESLEILFHECEGGGDYDSLCQSSAQWRMVNSLLIATVLRAALVVLSYGCKVPAGIFVPSMAIGATFGRMVGILVKALYTAFPHASIFSACQPDVPCITPGTYAFLGAAAALAGVTRITVAVVVIMFELTGALTYILPTMFVVMITKGVGDLYGKGGISDQTIRFQGYPFLDKDEHVFGLPVADIMTRGPAVLYGAGMPLAEVEQRLASGPYKGLPVVRSAEDPTLLGYAGKTEMRYAIAKARRARSTLAPTTLCCFTSEADNDEASGLGVHPLAQHPPTPIVSTFETMEPNNGKDDEHQGLMGGQDSDDEHDSLGEAGGGIDGEGDDDVLELGGWMEQTPLCVQPSMPLEVVMDLFKKMGPRVIIVTRLGRVVGLVTVKDVLKHHAATEHAAAVAASAARDVRSGPGLPSAAAVPQDGFGGDLELALSDLYTWFLTYARTLAPIAAKVRGWFPANGAGRSAARPQAPPGYSRPSRQAEAADEDEQREQFVLAGEGDE